MCPTQFQLILAVWIFLIVHAKAKLKDGDDKGSTTCENIPGRKSNGQIYMPVLI
jgi:hypothetical protein